MQKRFLANLTLANLELEEREKSLNAPGLMVDRFKVNFALVHVHQGFHLLTNIFHARGWGALAIIGFGRKLGHLYQDWFKDVSVQGGRLNQDLLVGFGVQQEATLPEPRPDLRHRIPILG